MRRSLGLRPGIVRFPIKQTKIPIVYKTRDWTGGVQYYGRNDMNFKTRTIRGALLAVTVALAVASVPAAGVTADAGGKLEKRAILKAIL